MRTSFLRTLALTLVAATAEASVVAYETIEEMAARVPLIVRGTVLRSVSGWDESRQRIWTWTEIHVVDTIKGHSAELIVVKQPGGEIEGIGQLVAGAARFKDGEECVLLLEPAPDEKQSYRVSGLSFGKVLLTDWLGQRAAVRDTHGLSLAVPAGRKVAPVQSPEFLGSPEAFIEKLRAAARAGR